MVDDDMDMSALPKTNYIKSIVTSECKMDMERKGVQRYQSQLTVRGNKWFRHSQSKMCIRDRPYTAPAAWKKRNP